MDTHPFIVPAWGSMEEWNRAFDKVEDYLRAHRIDSRLQRAILIQRMLTHVAATAHPDPLEPGTVEIMAIAECRRMMNAWFAHLMDGTGANLPTDTTDQRIAMLVSDSARRWPYTFMEESPPPAEMRRALQSSALRAGPKLAISHMVPRPIDMGLIPDLARGTLTALARWPLLRFMIVWCLYLLILAGLFFWTRR